MLGTPRHVGAGSAHLGQATTSSCRNQPLGQAGARESGAGGGRREERSGQSLMIFLFWESLERVKFPVGKKGIMAFSQADCWKLCLCRA